MDTKMRAMKIAAKRLGITLDEYISKRNAGLKWCTKCKTWQSVSDFAKDKTRGDGLKSICNSCEYTRHTPGPTRRERQEQQMNGLAWCRSCQKWQPIKIVYRGICRPCQNAQDRERYASDRRYRQERRQYAHARKRGVKPIPSEGQDRLMEEFDGRCAYCGAPAETWDHIFPIKEGGETTPGNIVPACISCNSSKKDQDIWEWLEKKGITPGDELVNRIILAECGLYE